MTRERLSQVLKNPTFPFWCGHFPLVQRSLGWDHFHFLLFSKAETNSSIFQIKCKQVFPALLTGLFLCRPVLFADQVCCINLKS